MSIQRNLSPDSYCITKDSVDDYHYGVIDSAAFDKLINVLTAETLGELEYLSEDEFKSIIQSSRPPSFLGNQALIT